MELQSSFFALARRPEHRHRTRRGPANWGLLSLADHSVFLNSPEDVQGVAGGEAGQATDQTQNENMPGGYQQCRAQAGTEEAAHRQDGERGRDRGRPGEGE